MVRIGGFIALSGDRYLNYNPKLGTFSVFARQPRASCARPPAHTSATSGYTRPTSTRRAACCSRCTRSAPTRWERIEKGEEVGYVILLVGVIGLVVLDLPARLPVPRAAQGGAPAPAPRPADARQPARPRARHVPRRSQDDRGRRRGRRAADLRGGAQGGAQDRALPGVPAPRGRGRPAARPDRNRDRYDHHLPEHHRVRLVRSEADGGRHRPGDDRHRARPRHRDPAAVHQRGLATLSRGVVQVLDEQSNGLLAEHIERKTGCAEGRMPSVVRLPDGALPRRGRHDRGGRPVRGSGSSSAASCSGRS